MKDNLSKFGGIVLFLILAFICLGGCQDNHEIGNLAVILGVAVEPTDNGGLRATIELAHRDSVNSEDNSVVLSVEADDWQDATDQLKDKTDKKLYWGHMVLLVLGQSFTQEQMNSYIKLFYTDQRLSPTIYVAIAVNSAEDIFSSSFGESIYISEGVAERLAMEQKKKPSLCYTGGEWMQNIYYNKTCKSIAVLSIDEGKIRIDQRVKFNES